MSGIVQVPAERFAHGTRSRYVKGCRCAPCRESNRVYYHLCQARDRQRLAELEANDKTAEQLLGPAETAISPQVWTAPDGTKRTRFYSRACPGFEGSCPANSHLRKDSKGGLCGSCRDRLGYAGLVSAEKARAHLLELQKAGLGRRAVAAACDIASSLVGEITRGEKLKIRAVTERRILAVDAGARADGARVPAARTWSAVRALLRMGWTKGAINQQALGNRTAALQVRRGEVLASTEHAIVQLLQKSKDIRTRQLEAKKRLKRERRRCPRCGRNHKDDKLAADWCRANRSAPLEQQEVG